MTKEVFELPVYPNYWYFDDVFTKKECDQIIDIGNNCRLMDGQTGGMVSKTNESGAIRTDRRPNMSWEEMRNQNVDLDGVFTRDSSVAWLHNPHVLINDEEVNTAWIYDKLLECVTTANYSANWNFDIDFAETIQFTKYKNDQFYSWHKDCQPGSYILYDEEKHPDEIAFHHDEDGKKIQHEGENVFNQPFTCHKDYDGKIRKLTISCVLSDEDNYEGGEFMFDLGPHERAERYVEAEELSHGAGTAIVFPSDTYHQVKPVLSGERYTLVMWSLGAPFK